AANRALIGWHDDGTCDDGAGKRAPSDFVDTGNMWSQLAAELTLEGLPAVTRALSCGGACVVRHVVSGLGVCLRNNHANFLFSDSGTLASQPAQVEQLRPANATATNDRDVGEHRAVRRE